MNGKIIISAKIDKLDEVYLRGILDKCELTTRNKFINSLIKVIKSDPGVEALLVKRIIKLNQHVDKDIVDEKAGIP
jgi:hypothetical protein